MTGPYDVEFARLAAGQAELVEDVSKLGERMAGVEREWAHFAPKIDEIHRAVYVGNGGKSIRERLSILEATSPLEHSGLGAETKRVKEASIDWKTVAGLVLGLLNAVLLLYLTSALSAPKGLP